MPKERIAAEAQIRTTVLEAARARAETQARELHAVARALLVTTSKQARPSEDGVAHPAQRPEEVDRKRIRFSMDREEYGIIKDRIRASGRSLTAALEEELERYARTGEL